MKTFIDDDFLLHSAAGRELYHGVAWNQPIYDYHCHLSPALIADNHQFRNLYEVWLGGDHYKWRAMRANGVAEEFCTGGADDYEKFLAFARTVPRTLRNPLHHWTHLELLRTFEIDDLLDESTAPSIWERANERLASPDYSAKALITRAGVRVICTTDDPTDDLAAHQRIREDAIFGTRVYPTFRPDRALAVDRPEEFNAWIEKLQAASGVDCTTFDGFLDALAQRHGAFHEARGRLSDHGLRACPGRIAPAKKARKTYDAARAGQAAKGKAAEGFAGHLMLFFGHLDAAKGWTKQLHLGALRNTNRRLFTAAGPDAGADSIGDWPQAEALARYLDALDSENALPKFVLYNLNPADNYAFATMAGNFQDGATAGKIQFGSGWWFLDQKEGMEWQLNALSHLGLLSRFVGMLTDSRSFLSYPRHEYFRRILCEVVGRDVERRELPRDMDLLGGLVRDVCYENAVRFFGLKLNT